MELLFAVLGWIERVLGLVGAELALAPRERIAERIAERNDDELAQAAREEWIELKHFVATVEDRDEDMADVCWREPVTWWTKQLGWEELQRRGQSPDAALRQLGFRDRDHYDRVSRYVRAKWSYLGKNEDGQAAVLLRDELTHAAMRARSSQAVLGAFQAEP